MVQVLELHFYNSLNDCLRLRKCLLQTFSRSENIFYWYFTGHFISPDVPTVPFPGLAQTPTLNFTKKCVISCLKIFLFYSKITQVQSLYSFMHLYKFDKHQYRWSIKNVTILMRILTSEARACPAAPAQRCVREIELATHLWRQ